jgi:hypothetical protein
VSEGGNIVLDNALNLSICTAVGAFVFHVLPCSVSLVNSPHLLRKLVDEDIAFDEGISFPHERVEGAALLGVIRSAAAVAALVPKPDGVGEMTPSSLDLVCIREDDSGGRSTRWWIGEVHCWVWDPDVLPCIIGVAEFKCCAWFCCGADT